MKKIYLFWIFCLIFTVNPLFSAEMVENKIEKGKNYSIMCDWGYDSYLAINGTVKKNDYQWAHFVTQPYFDNNQETYRKEFTIIPEEDGTNTFRIKCSNWGYDSYLAINGKVKKDDYQWAFFGTQDYLDDNKEKYFSKFILERNGSTLRIKCGNWGYDSYLAIGKIKKNDYQKVFFGSRQYLENNQEKYNILLKLIVPTKVVTPTIFSEATNNKKIRDGNTVIHYQGVFNGCVFRICLNEFV